MDGQFSLFEKVKGISAPTTWNAKKSLSQYTAGLESQKAYMESYSEYYAQAAEKVRAADSSAEGVVANSFLSQLADGSAESAEILANIATATPEQVSAMVQAYADVQAAKDEYAATMAETETNFSESMAQLQADLESTVQAMDFSGEAASNAQASLNAFISQADGYVGKAAAAYAKVAAAAAAALKFNPTVPGYASGTEYATSGVRLVGEEGPELVFFRGGERVLNADQTVEALSAKPIQAMPIDSGSAERSGGSTYNIDVTIPNINAKGVDAEEVVAAIAGTLRDEIVSTMEEIEEDRYRRNLV